MRAAAAASSAACSSSSGGRARRRLAHRRLLRELGTDRREQRVRRLAPEHEPFAGAPEPVQRRRCRLPASGRVRELLLRPVALAEDALEPLGRTLPRECSAGAALVRLAPPLGDRREVELGDARPEPRHLGRELLGPLGRSGLGCERPEPRPHLGLDVPRPFDLDADPRQLELGPVPPALELSEPCRFLDQLASPLGARAEDLLDPPLADHRVHPAPEPEVGEQLDHVRPPYGRAVEQVLALAAPVQPPRDRQLRVIERPAVGAIDQQLDFCEIRRAAAAAPGEQHVVRLLRAELARAQAPGSPHDRVDDVRLARSVRADHHCHARLEPDLERVDERLEPADLDRLEMHGSGSLTRGADV